MNNKHYIGFEGEPEITFANGDKDNYLSTLTIWNGYFETILDCMLDSKQEVVGILNDYCLHEGWYDESSWLIEDVDLLINQMKNVFIYLNSKYDSLNDLRKSLPVVVSDIIQFLEESLHKHERVYLLYD